MGNFSSLLPRSFWQKLSNWASPASHRNKSSLNLLLFLLFLLIPQIIVAASPVKSIEQIASSDESDSDDDNPLALSTAVCPTEILSDFLDGELELEELGTCNQDLLSKAINTDDVITNVSFTLKNIPLFTAYQVIFGSL